MVLYRREGLTGWFWLIFKDLWHTVQVLFGRCPGKAERIGIIWRGFAAGCGLPLPFAFPAGRRSGTAED